MSWKTVQRCFTAASTSTLTLGTMYTWWNQAGKGEVWSTTGVRGRSEISQRPTVEAWASLQVHHLTAQPCLLILTLTDISTKNRCVWYDINTVISSHSVDFWTFCKKILSHCTFKYLMLHLYTNAWCLQTKVSYTHAKDLSRSVVR